jgi:hypothetical protein
LVYQVDDARYLAEVCTINHLDVFNPSTGNVLVSIAILGVGTYLGGPGVGAYITGLSESAGLMTLSVGAGAIVCMAPKTLQYALNKADMDDAIKSAAMGGNIGLYLSIIWILLLWQRKKRKDGGNE